MIRRGGGRTPPFILVGLLLLLLILGFNYWTLSSQNADLRHDIEKLQAEVKISAVKQDQSEKKNAALQETVHEMDTLSDKLKKKLQEESDQLKTKDQDNQKKEYEITSLKSKIVTLQEQLSTLQQQVEDRDVEVSKLKETNKLLTSLRDDAVDAIADKDSQINTLRRQLEQEKGHSNMQQFSLEDLKKKLTHTFGDLSECQDRVSELEALLRAERTKAEEQVAAQKREVLAAAPPKQVPGPFNIPGNENKEIYQGPGQLGYARGGAVKTRDSGMGGIIFHRDTPILPRDPPNAPRAKPRFSVADMTQNMAEKSGVGTGGKEGAPHPPIDDQNHPQLQPPGPAVMERPAKPVPANNRRPLQPPHNNVIQPQQQLQQDVLAPPPQMPRHQDTSIKNVQSAVDKPEPAGQKQVTHNQERLKVVSKQMQQREKQEQQQGKGKEPGEGEGNNKPLENTRGETEDKNHAQEQIDEPLIEHQKPDDHNHAGEQDDDAPMLVQNPLPALQQPMAAYQPDQFNQAYQPEQFNQLLPDYHQPQLDPQPLQAHF